MEGLFGKYVMVNLSTQEISNYEIPEEWMRKFLGGRGVAARILLEELQGGEDPLGPDNLLVFATGPLQGQRIAGAGRHVVMSKSPKTKSIGGAYAGGFFAQELATSGYDGIIVKGCAEKPVYISLIHGKAEIHEADKLWGLDVAETEKKLQDIYGNVRVTSIGLAGENLVQFSCVMNDCNRAAARLGFGAVMGSKKLKAIAVRGGIKRPVADKETLKKLKGKFARELAENAGLESLAKYGTSGGTIWLSDKGILPTKGFQEGKFEEADKIDGLRMHDTILAGRDNCTACPLRCKRVVKTEFRGERVCEKYGGPEYETVGALGSLLLNNNLESIALANQKCNQYGLDTISTGNIIAYAIEATEKGFMESNLKWGNAEEIVKVIDKIARREGLGDTLAKGIGYLSQKFEGSFAVQIKGVEVPLHEPRGNKGLAICYATSPRGATHMEGLHDVYLLEQDTPTPELGVNKRMSRFSYEGKPRVAKIYEDLRSFTNSLVLCAFVTQMAGENYNYPLIRDMVNAVTGLDITVKEMMAIGERNYNLLKLFAAREGYTREDDGLPSRFKEPLSKGASSGESIPDDRLGEMIDEYYKLRGYDEYGPTEKKLEQLDLDEFKGIIPRK